MTSRSSDLKPTHGTERSQGPPKSVSGVSTDLVRIALTALALKNSELHSRGFCLGNRPDEIWYQEQLRRIGIRRTLLSVRRNLRSLCRAGILDRPVTGRPLKKLALKTEGPMAKFPEYRLSFSTEYLLKLRLRVRITIPEPIVMPRSANQPSRFHAFLNALRSVLRR